MKKYQILISRGNSENRQKVVFGNISATLLGHHLVSTKIKSELT